MFSPVTRYLVPVLLSGFLASTPTIASSEAESSIQTLLQEFLAGASVYDRAMHSRFWAEDLVYTSSSGARYGKQTILDGLDDAPAPDPRAPVYTADQVQIKMLEQGVAVLTFRLVATPQEGSASYYLNTGVFEYHDDEWRASTWQATRVPPLGE